MKAILRYILLILTLYATIFLYQIQLGAIPFFLLSFYLFYEAFRTIRGGRREEKWGNGRPS
ncbi:hypothetical protein JI667_20325 [Bacillus sp. NTK074B]|uniref:hypothetical protein n=1 Tax=Bacillus sp. NTK074B TaxID=2802174 RepID=UPI001A8EE1C8|nr:hypothetical protein [Bacillus sp. NTK074B]